MPGRDGARTVTQPKGNRWCDIGPKEVVSFNDVHEHALCGLVRSAGKGKSGDVRSPKLDSGDAVEMAKTEQREVLTCELQREPEEVCAWEVEVQDVLVTWEAIR